MTKRNCYLVGALLSIATLAVLLPLLSGKVDVRISSQDLSDPYEVLLEARRIAVQVDRQWERSYLLNQTAITQSLIGDLEGARTSVAHGRPEDEKFFPIGAVVERMIQDGRLQDAEQFVLAFDDTYRFKAESLGALAVEYARRDEIDTALRLSALINPYYRRYPPIGETAVALARRGEVDKALELLSDTSLTDQQEIPDAWKTTEPMQDIALLLIENNHLAEARRVLELYRREQPGEYYFRSIVRTLASHGHLDDALTQAHSFPEKYIRAILIAQAARGLHLSGKKDSALKVMEMAMHAAQGTPEDQWRELAFNAVVRGYAVLGEPDRARAIALSFDDTDTATSLINVAAHDLNELGRVDQARDLLSSALPLIESLVDSDANPSAVSWYARELARSGDAETSFRLARSLPSNSLTAKCLALGAVGRANGREGRGAVAVEALRLIDEEARSADCAPQVEFSSAYRTAQETGHTEAAALIREAIYQRYGGRQAGIAAEHLENGRFREVLETLRGLRSPAEVSRCLADHALWLYEKTQKGS